MAAKTYSSLNITALFDGVKLTGWNEITITRPKKRWKQESDASGGSIFIEEPGWKEAEININVDQTGAANNILSAAFNSGDTGLFICVDNNGFSFLLANVKVNHDNSGYAKDKKDKVWGLVGFAAPQMIAGD